MSYFKNGFKFIHDKNLDGLYSMYMIFSTNLYKNHTLYNSWDFKTPEEYDHFWFDSANTQFVYHAQNYWIGKD